MNACTYTQVEAHIGPASQRLLLSDGSQAAITAIGYPEHLADVTLTEVFRCSKRIVR